LCPPDQFARLLAARAVDVAIGPMSKAHAGTIRAKEFLRYQLVAVVGPHDPLAKKKATAKSMGQQTWLLGPSAVDAASVASQLLRRHVVPEANQRIFQSHAAALSEAQAGHGVALCAAHSVSAELVDGTWAIFSLRHELPSQLSNELIRFVSTPRAIQAMLTGSGSNIARFRPRVHVTLWS
jgi:DNA-binding transcriptional LysR family regulator